MSVEERRPEADEPIERAEERQAEHLKEIDQELEQVDRMIHQAEEKEKKMYEMNQD
jgi:hypothetical protein